MKTIKYLSFLIVVFFFASMSSFAQEDPATDKKEEQECSKGCCSGQKSDWTMTMAHMDTDSTHNMHHQMKSQGNDETSIVREGDIDIDTIDKNKDGKVFQDQMDWNVIADEAGECPLCGMNLKEVTLEKAKENLVKHNFKVTE